VTLCTHRHEIGSGYPQTDRAFVGTVCAVGGGQHPTLYGRGFAGLADMAGRGIA
jgi:hypothetical protein